MKRRIKLLALAACCVWFIHPAFADEPFTLAAIQADKRVAKLFQITETNKIDDWAVFEEAATSNDGNYIKHAILAAISLCESFQMSLGDAQRLIKIFADAMERRYPVSNLRWQLEPPHREICGWYVSGLNTLYFQYPVLSPGLYIGWQNGTLQTVCVELVYDRAHLTADEEEVLLALYSDLASPSAIAKCVPYLADSMAKVPLKLINDTLHLFERHYLFGRGNAMGLVGQDSLRKAEPAILTHLSELNKADAKELAKTRQRLKALLSSDSAK